MSTDQGYQKEGFTDYEEQLNWDTVGSPVPIGDYDLELTKCEYAQDKNGKHMLKVQFKVERAYDQENDEKSKDRMVFENFGFTQQSGFRVKSFAAATATELPVMVSQEVLEGWAASVIGMKVGATLKHREWNGALQANIGKFMQYQSDSMTGELPGAAEEQAHEEAAEEQAPAPRPRTQSLRQATQKPAQTNGTAKPMQKNGASKPVARPPQTARR